MTAPRQWGARRGRGGARPGTGGRQPGAGRKRAAGGRVKIGVRLSRAQVAAAQDRAAELTEAEGRRVSRAEVYRRALAGALQLGADPEGELVPETLVVTEGQAKELRGRAHARGAFGSITSCVVEIFSGESQPLEDL